MKRIVGAAAVLMAGLTASGCVERQTQNAALVANAAPPPNSSAATWQMPWQLSPITFTSASREGESVMAFVPQTGMVRATPKTMASIGRPLQAMPGRNRIVEPCRDVVRSEASKIGGRDVEAVSAGPQRRDPQGRFVAPVHMRITYTQLSGTYEVREATVTCVVDSRGKVVDAFA